MNWDNAVPSAETLAAFTEVKDDLKEFPQSYSGQAWLAAYRLWKVVTEKPERNTLADDAMDLFRTAPDWNIKGLGLSGFMAGYALNAVRQMMNLPAVGNPAILTVADDGTMTSEPHPVAGSPESEMKLAMTERTN